MTPQLNLLFDATEGLAHADPTIVPGNNLIVCNMRNADSWSAVTTVNTHVSGKTSSSMTEDCSPKENREGFGNEPRGTIGVDHRSRWH